MLESGKDQSSSAKSVYDSGPRETWQIIVILPIPSPAVKPKI